MGKEITYKIYLEENEMPKAWYNLRADMKNKPEPLLEHTKKYVNASNIQKYVDEEGES